MGDHHTIDSLLATAAAGCIVEIPGGAVEWGAATTRSLHTRTADGPVFSADGSLAVIRTDPKLAAALLEIARITPTLHAGWENRALRRAAALLAAPAPADPEEDGDGG